MSSKMSSASRDVKPSANVTNVTSFVTEILAITGSLEKDDLNTKLGKLGRRIDDVKIEVHEALRKKYVEFYPNFDATRELCGRVKSVVDEMETLKAVIQKQVKTQLQVSSIEYSGLSCKYEEFSAVLCLLDDVMQAHGAIQSMQRHTQMKDFVAASSAAADVQRHLDKLQGHSDCLHVLTALRKAYWLQREQLESCLREEWLVLVKGPSVVSPNGNEVCIQIASGPGANERITAVAQALCQADVLETTLHTFGERLLQHVVTPVAAGNVVSANYSEQLDAVKLVIVMTAESAQRCSATKTLEIMHTVMSFLKNHLFRFQIRKSADAESTAVLMASFGHVIGAKFIDVVITQCLAPSVPKAYADLKRYGDTITAVNTLQKSLIEYEFLPSDAHTLSDYVGSVDVLFANRRCETILAEAHRLMLSELHSTEVAVQSDCLSADTLDLPGSGTSKKAAKDAVVSDTKLHSVFTFPACHISVSTRQLVKLAYDTLHEAASSEPQCAVQLFYAVRHVFEMYCSVVPCYHKQTLLTLPQPAAVMHNDCMYISHHLMTLGHQWRPCLPTPLSDGAATFVDLVPVLRRLGAQCLLTQVQQQKSQLMECLATAKGFGCLDDEGFRTAEKAIGQTLIQLRHLQAVWKDVLPVSVYNKTIGMLLNAVVTSVVASVIAIEDISEPDANSLYLLLRMLTEAAPSLAQSDGGASMGVHRLVPRWSRLTELMIVLKARLPDITDRWADGKGPLAGEFTPSEMKKLVRALFQNTEKRSAVIASIH